MWTRLKKLKVTITPGFLLLLGVMFYLDDGIGILPWAVAAAALHELGHVGAAALFGGRAEALSLSAVGAELRFGYPGVLSYGRESVIALAGPVMNLLAGLPALWMGAYLPAAVCLGLGLFNLLPILPLDGGRVFGSLLAEHFGPDAAERVLAVTAGILIGVLVGLGVVAVVKFANVMLLTAALWLLLGATKKEHENFSNK